MRIAFDIDDTITRCPEFFAVVSRALRAEGHRVYVVSYREDRGFAEEDLAEHCISFDELVLPTEDELRRAEPSEWRANAARWKAEVCRTLAIDVLFEDMPDVIAALDRTTVAFMAIDPSLGIVKYEAS